LIEKRGFFGGNKFVSACVERDKKDFEKMDFCAQLPTFLIENLTRITGIFCKKGLIVAIIDSIIRGQTIQFIF
jgi:hypothetical protein